MKHRERIKQKEVEQDLTVTATHLLYECAEQDETEQAVEQFETKCKEITTKIFSGRTL